MRLAQVVYAIRRLPVAVEADVAASRRRNRWGACLAVGSREAQAVQSELPALRVV